MDPIRSRYKQVGAKFRGADDSRAARAIATKDGQRVRRSTALHARRNIPDDLTPVNTPEAAAPLARLPATAALANVRAKIAQLASQKTVACSTGTAVQQGALTVVEDNATTVTKKQTKSIEQLTKERMEALKIYKQRKEKQLEREKKNRKPTFWIGVAKREPKVLLLPTVAESNSSKLETPGCTPSKQSLPVWHTGFSSISKKIAPLPSTVTRLVQTTSRNSRTSSRNLFSSTLKGSLGQAADPRLQRQHSRGSVAPPTDGAVHRRNAEEQFRPADPDSFAPSGYTFTAPDGLQQPRLVSAGVSPRRPSTIRFSKVPVPPATPSERVPRRMPTSKTPKPGAPRARSRSTSTVSSDCTTATSPCSSQKVQPARSSSVRSRKESSDCDAQTSIQTSTRESYLDESQPSNVSSSSSVRTTRASKTSTSSFTPSGAAINSSVLSESERRSARASNQDSLGIEILEASPPSVARFKRRNPIHQLLPISSDLLTEAVVATVRDDSISHSREVESEECLDASEVQLKHNVSEHLLQTPHPSIEDDKESLPEDCSFPDVFQEPSNEHVIPPTEQSSASLTPNNQAMKRKRSSLVSLPPSAKKSKHMTRMSRSETSVQEDIPLQPESNQVKARRSSRSSTVDSCSSLAHVESPSQTSQNSTPDSSIVKSETETKSSTAMTPLIIHKKSPLGRTPTSSGHCSLASDSPLPAHAGNSSLIERNKSAARDIAMKNCGTSSFSSSNLLPPFKGNDLGCSPQFQQTQARLSISKFLNGRTVGQISSVAPNISESAESPIRTPVCVPVPSTSNVDDPPQTPVMATPKPGRKAKSSLRKSSRLTLSSLEESSVATCVTPTHSTQRLTATTPCSRSTRRSLAVHADATWQEYCTTPSVTTNTPGKQGRRKIVQVKLVTEDASKKNGDCDKSVVTTDAVVSHVKAARAATENITEQILSAATFKTPQSSSRGLSFLSTDTTTDGVSHLPSAEKDSSDVPGRSISCVSWMVHESPFIDHESRSTKRRKASERAMRQGTSPFDLGFTADDLAAAGSSPALPSVSGGPSDGLAELLRPSTPRLDQPASPDVWGDMSTSSHTADPISDPLSITLNPEIKGKEDTVGSACDTVVKSVDTETVPNEASSNEMELPDIVLSINDQSRSDDKDDPQEEGGAEGDGPSPIDVAAWPATNKKGTTRRSRQSLAVAAALESSRRVLLSAATGQENRPPRVSFALDAHNNRVSLGLFAPGALTTPALTGFVVPGQDLICLESPQSGLKVPTGTLGEDLISLDTPTPKGKKGLKGRSRRVSQLAALYESPSPSTPHLPSLSTLHSPSAKAETPLTLRRSSRRSVLTPRPDNLVVNIDTA